MEGTLHTEKSSVANRGERLFPSRSSRLYWILTRLREEFERIARDHLSKTIGRAGLLVDFGCGNTPYRPLFEGCVDRYVGCDLPGNSSADMFLEKPDTLPFGDSEADVVLSSQVLEHVVNPQEYLAECARVLRPDGVLILSTHGVWKYHPDPLDLWRWTSDGLRRVISDAGFSISTFRGVLGPAAYGLQIWQDATISRLPYRLRPAFARFLQWRIRRADLACSPQARDIDAGVYVVVAIKT